MPTEMCVIWKHFYLEKFRYKVTPIWIESAENFHTQNVNQAQLEDVVI